MEKDLFELMTKMYEEMQNGFNNVNVRFDNLESRVDSLETESKKTNMLIENEITPGIKALFDGYKQNTEAITRIDDSIKDLTMSVNDLSIKTLKNENNIIAFSKKIDTMSNIQH